MADKERCIICGGDSRKPRENGGGEDELKAYICCLVDIRHPQQCLIESVVSFFGLIYFRIYDFFSCFAAFNGA